MSKTMSISYHKISLKAWWQGRDTHNARRVTHITPLTRQLRTKYHDFRLFKIWFMYLDIYCPTCKAIIKIGAFNSEKLGYYNHRYKKTHSEGDTHNAELRWTYIEMKSHHPLIMFLHHFSVWHCIMVMIYTHSHD